MPGALANEQPYAAIAPTQASSIPAASRHFSAAADADDLIKRLAANRTPAGTIRLAARGGIVNDTSPEAGPDDPNAVEETPDATPALPDPVAAVPVPQHTGGLVAPAASLSGRAAIASMPSPTPTDPIILALIDYADGISEGMFIDYDTADLIAAKAFYATYTGKPLWVDKAGFNRAAYDVLGELRSAADWGLDPKAFKITQDANSVGNPANAAVAYPELERVLAELEMTLNVLLYARHARGGRITDPTTQLSSYLDRKPQLLDPLVVLADLARADDKAAYLRGLHPQHPQFTKLRNVLVSLRSDSALAKAADVPSRGPTLRPGDRDPSIDTFRRRLGIKAPPAAADGTVADLDLYDQDLANAVKSFQEVRGIEPADGTINKTTRRAMNRDERIDPDKIIANMEQWRWMPADLGQTHVHVNIPEFLVRVRKGNSIIHEERVVTGSLDKQTPIFSKDMRTVVLWPYWVVPDSIKVRELWPRIAGGGDPIAGRGLRLMRNGKAVPTRSVNWSKSDIRNWEVVQPPGPGNVLGKVKFLFPNKHSVYLHDTPSKGLFAASQRTFSHGCVRVRNPIRLAEVLLGEGNGLSVSDVTELLKSGPEDNKMKLEKRIPVHLTYFTAWVDDKGRVRSFSDVYGHEKRIKLALAGQWNRIEKNPDHLLPLDPNEVSALSVRTRSRLRELPDDDDDDRSGGFFYDQAAFNGRVAPAYLMRGGRMYVQRPSPSPNRRNGWRVRGVGDTINRSLGGTFYD